MSTKIQMGALRLAVLAAAVLAAQSFAALPEIRITTENSKNPDQNTASSGGGWGMPAATTYKYVRITDFKLSGTAGGNDISRSGKPDSVKVRGNSTAGADKKPYKIKFGERIKVFGDTAAKSWVLLANWYDGTFALNAMAFELGKRLGLEFTNKYWFVDVYINGSYKGIYQLTEQIQSHRGRVDLKENKRGWLAEFDFHDAAADEKNTWFKTDQYNIGTFIKSPELDDTAFTKNPNDASQLNFVKNDINNLVKKMYNNGSKDNWYNNGYRDLIDLESFAKYVLIQLVLDNHDFNSKAQDGFLLGSNYCYRIDSARTTRIKAGPLWDFDLGAGIERSGGIGAMGANSTYPLHYKTYQDSIRPTHAFYERLWDDPAFKAKYYKTWIKYKKDFEAMSQLIDQIKSQVEGSITAKGNNLWNNNAVLCMTFNCPSSPKSGPLTTQTFNTEVQGLKTWWTNRLNWVDTKLKSYNIDTTKDVIQTQPSPTSIASNQAKLGNSLSLVKNGLKINAASAASIKVFALNGAAVTRQSFAAGRHTVSLGSLPRGMYLVRVNLDGVKQTVKVAVR